MMNMNKELMAKARAAKSAEELLALAKENGVELTEERAKVYFEQMNQSGELADDELDSVAGGGCSNINDEDYLLVNPHDWCHYGIMINMCTDCSFYQNYHCYYKKIR